MPTLLATTLPPSAVATAGALDDQATALLVASAGSKASRNVPVLPTGHSREAVLSVSDSTGMAKVAAG
ncbi:MAG: hypothetical protein BWY37_02174 [Firmicutes bacterium ADurb.Bin262]|nr:MAG: hypothetical protein BWY37_02174 [Firmicutes bacterium ADurb.Bin262]